MERIYSPAGGFGAPTGEYPVFIPDAWGMIYYIACILRVLLDGKKQEV
jgi:hypothetical protein